MANSIDCYKCPFSYHTCGYVKFSPKIKPEPSGDCPFLKIASLEEKIKQLKEIVIELGSELDRERGIASRNFGVQM